MTRNILMIFMLLLASCAVKPLDEEKARAVVEELITRSDKEQFDGIEELYTSAFNASEPLDIKKEKLSRLKYTMGPMKSMEFVSATHKAEFGEPQQVVIKYRVVHQRVTSLETFTVQEDEGGYKIATHMVEAENS